MSESTTITVRDGAIWWHGIHKSPQEAERLRDEFERQGNEQSWWASTARKYASALTDALEQVREDEDVV